MPSHLIEMHILVSYSNATALKTIVEENNLYNNFIANKYEGNYPTVFMASGKTKLPFLQQSEI